MHILKKILKIKLIQYYGKKYDPKIKTVKYLVLFDHRDQNKIWLILTLPQKGANLLALYLVIKSLMRIFKI